MHHDYADSDIDSEAMVTIAFADGCTGVCDLSGRAAIVKPRFAVHGTKATLVKYGLDPQEDAMKRGESTLLSNPPPTTRPSRAATEKRACRPTRAAGVPTTMT